MSLGRGLAVAALVAGVQAAGAQTAQTAHTRPDQIICAMSGSCDNGAAAKSDQQISIGQERSFSLVRPDSAKRASAAPAATASAPAVAPRRYASVSGNAPRAAAETAPAAGRMDMLVTFPLGSADLTSSGKEEVQAFATAMAAPALSGMRFNVEGHTDAIGGRDYNLDLSRRRAQSVVDYLVSLGVDRSRLDPEGFGFDKPRPGMGAKNPANRRVEFVKAG